MDGSTVSLPPAPKMLRSSNTVTTSVERASAAAACCSCPTAAGVSLSCSSATCATSVWANAKPINPIQRAPSTPVLWLLMEHPFPTGFSRSTGYFCKLVLRLMFTPTVSNPPPSPTTLSGSSDQIHRQPLCVCDATGFLAYQTILIHQAV